MSLRIFKNDLFKIIIGSLFFAAGIIFDALTFSLFSNICCILALLVTGREVFWRAFRGILRRDLFDEQFLMSIASLGAIILGDFSEGAAVMLFFSVGEYFQKKAVNKSRSAIRSLMDICPDTARVLTDGVEELTDADDVEVGSIIVIRAGERVPIDCIVINGGADLDVSALTGESMPVAADVGSELKSGTIVLNGVLTASTVCSFEMSTANKILELCENAAERKSKTENFISSFAKIYTPSVVILAILLAIIPAIFEITTFSESLHRALAFLVISCPCALVISVPMAFFGGIGRAAGEGILFKGASIFSPLSRAKIFLFDKTGTLTNGEFEIEKIETFGESEDEILNILASLESNSNHPIARSLSKNGRILEGVCDFKEIAGRGVLASLNGEIYRVGNRKMMVENGIEIPESYDFKHLFITRENKLIAVLNLSDKIKSEGKSALNQLKALGAQKCAILSGDSPENVKRVSENLDMDYGHSLLLPEEKYEKLLEYSKQGITVYVGDGINDAPSLVRADVGIAMGAIGSDVAIESADIVIMSDNLKKLPLAVKIARKTMIIAKENIVFALGVKLLTLVLGAFGITGMWFAVFGDVGVSVIAILNSMRTLFKRG
jgi:Cd2+/Zn2+-exporting ATPase